MQKDERFLLRPWLAYHGWLFGFGNLYVIDNGSERPDVQATLEQYESAGVNVIRDFSGRKAYGAKGAVVGAVIRNIQKVRHYDFIIPLDCDEFIMLREEGGCSIDREAILAYLFSLKDADAILRFPYQLLNHPVVPDIYHYKHMPKIFFVGGTLVRVDHGNHSGRSSRSNEVRDTRLIQFHFHFKQFDEFIRQARQSWIGHVSFDDKAALLGYKGPSEHLAPYLLKDRETYYGEFLGRPYFFIPEFRQLLERLQAPLDLPDDTIPPALRPRLDRPLPARGDGDRGAVVFIPDPSAATGGYTAVEFHEERYMEANGDLADANVDPTDHFCRFGFRERRPLR